VTCTVDGGYEVFSGAPATIIDGEVMVGNSKPVTCGRKASAGMKNAVTCTVHGQRSKHERDWSRATAH
jgi:hypothetical protein